MRLGGAFPETFASAPRIQIASLSGREKSQASAGVQGNLGISAVAGLLRPLFGPYGGAARQYVLAATDADVNSIDDDYASWAAHWKAKKGKERSAGGGATNTT